MHGNQGILHRRLPSDPGHVAVKVDGQVQDFISIRGPAGDMFLAADVGNSFAVGAVNAHNIHVVSSFIGGISCENNPLSVG